MKSQKQAMSVYHYNGLIRTYAGGCKLPGADKELKDAYMRDAWNLFEQMQTVDNLPVSVNVLNSLMQLYVNAHEPEKLENFVLPLYEKYEITLNEYSYQGLMGTSLHWQYI